jgi:predicted nucleotidyltransferase
MKTPALQIIIADIINILSPYSQLIKRVGVFGSLATGKFSIDSDIDIAIEYKTGDNFNFEQFAQFCEVCEQLTNNLANNYGRRIDLIHVEDNPRCLLHKIHDEVIWI